MTLSANKKILLITPYFAPQTHAAMFRVYKLARFLPSHGYEVHVLTVDTNYLYNEDPGLLDALPEGVHVHTAHYIEPTLRGLRMELGGKGRTFKDLKSQLVSGDKQKKSQTTTQLKNKPRLLSRCKNFVLSLMADWPDRYWTWYSEAVKEAKRIIEEHDINVIYTTTAPFTTLRIGEHLQLKCGVKWIADFRDPLGYSERFSASSSRARALEQQIVKRTMQSADHVVGLARSYQYIFKDLYNLEASRFTFIPTGADDRYIQACEPLKPNPDIFTVLFVGEFLDEYDNTYIFNLLAELQKNANKPLEIKVIGRIEVNKHRVLGLIERANASQLKQCCHFIDHLPQSDLYAEIAQASVCLLIPGISLWWTNFAKLVDYIALKKYVIANVPDISEARHELSKAGLGIFLGGDIKSDLEQLHLLVERKPGEDVNHTYCQQYLASQQVSAFVKVIEKVVQ